jgi:hypothetical protein
LVPPPKKYKAFICAEESKPTRESFAEPDTYIVYEPCGVTPTPSCEPLNCKFASPLINPLVPVAVRT